MRPLLLLPILGLAACVGVSSPRPPVADQGSPPAAKVAPISQVPQPAPLDRPPRNEPKPIWPARAQHIPASGLDLHVFGCDDREFRFTVADQAGGPGTRWQNAEVAAKANKSLVAINGGFFTPEGQTLGLVIDHGQRRGVWNRSSSLTSGVFEVTSDGPQLRRTNTGPPPRPPSHLIQTGPFLLEGGKSVAGLSRESRRPRSFLGWDGEHRWILGYTESATLDGLARTLARQPIPGIRLTMALNLDGGSSSQLWLGPGVKGGGHFHRPLWRKPVRNFILVHALP